MREKDGELSSGIATYEVSGVPQAKDKYTWTPGQEARETRVSGKD